MAIAKLVYDADRQQWSLRCRDSSDRWRPCGGIGGTSTVDPLRAEIDRGPTGIFWG